MTSNPNHEMTSETRRKEARRAGMQASSRRTRKCKGPCLIAAIVGVLAHACAHAQPSNPVVVTVHADRPIGTYTPIWNFFGADEPNFIYAPHGQKLLRELSDLSPAPIYFRPHNLLTTGNGEGSLKWGSTNAYKESADGTPIYDWTITDRIFDALSAAHVRPLVEIGFMPEALSMHPEPYRHTFPKGDIYTGWSYPPKDYGKWEKLVEAYAAHLKQRYGGATDNWLWEVWNEPDIGYWHGTPEEYDHLYDVSTQAIRTVMPKARIGGPEVTGITSAKAEAFLRQFLEHCAHGVNSATGKTGAPLDFISFHPKGRPVMVSGAGNAHVRMDIAHQLRATDRGMRIVASYPEWKNTPVILGESDPEGCAACQGAENGYRNGPMYGASVVEATIRTYEIAKKYGVKIEGAVTWAFEFENQPYFAGFRELATNGVDKPVLNAFRMMGMLRGNLLATESSGAMPLDDIEQEGALGAGDIDAVASGKDGVLCILLWNYHDDDLPGHEAAMDVKIDGMEAQKGKRLYAEEFRMDSMHSNAYTAWQQMGSPATPTEAEQRRLEAASGLERIVAPHALTLLHGTAVVSLALPRQGVSLIRLHWE